MKCPQCALAMPDGSTSCPKCEWKKPSSSWFRKLAIGLGSLIAILYVIGKIGGEAGSSSSTSTASTASEPAAAPAAPAAPPIEIGARKLWKEYDANEVSADDAYKGKRLLVTGTVTGIDKDLFDHIVVKLGGGNEFQWVAATMLPSEKSTAARLSKGTQATVVCTGNGRIIGDPQLEDCAFAR